MTITPDGRSIFVSVQLPYSGVLNEVIEGILNGNLFVGQSRGQFNGFKYILGFYYWIRFVGNEANDSETSRSTVPWRRRKCDLSPNSILKL
jgi:hypothetical protein